MIKEFLIEGKGYYNTIDDDYFLSGVDVGDIKSGYGYVEFKGTEKQLDKFLKKMYKDESTFKVIGIHTARQ